MIYRRDRAFCEFEGGGVKFVSDDFVWGEVGVNHLYTSFLWEI